MGGGRRECQLSWQTHNSGEYKARGGGRKEGREGGGRKIGGRKKRWKTMEEEMVVQVIKCRGAPLRRDERLSFSLLPPPRGISRSISQGGGKYSVLLSMKGRLTLLLFQGWPFTHKLA